MIVHDSPVVVHVCPPLLGVVRSVAVTVYPDTGDPCVFPGAAQLTTACWSPATAVTLLGGSVVAYAVTWFEGADTAESPMLEWATTVNV